MTPRTAKNITQHELIGLSVTLVEGSNHVQRPISGKVVDESQNTLSVKQGEAIKRIAKKDFLFSFTLPEDSIEVEGSVLVGRPEDRVKKRSKRRW